MARRCICARLLAAVQEDPRLRTLPMAARMLFLLVAEAAMRAAVPGVLPFAGTARVSLLVSAPETEVETHLETLRAEGLFVMPADGTLVVPLLAEAASRTDAARRNGTKGGRPRRGEAREEYLQRKQGEMMLALPGGVASAVAETQETQPAKPLARATTTTTLTSVSSEVSKSPAAARETPEWVLLGAEVVELAALDTARWQFNYQPVRGWLEAGSTPDQVRAAIRRVVERPGFSPTNIRTLTYFARAVEDERGRGVPSARAAIQRDTPEEAARMVALQARIEAAVAGRTLRAA